MGAFDDLIPQNRFADLIPEDTGEGRLKTAAKGVPRGAISAVSAGLKGMAVLNTETRKTPHPFSGLIQSGPPEAQRSYQQAESIDAWLDENLKLNPRYADEFLTGTLPQALGSTAAFLPAALGGPAGIAVTGALAAGGGAYESAKKHGATDEQAERAFWLNALAGTTEAVPLSRIITRINKATKGEVGKALKEVIASGFEEGSQEVFQQVVENAVAKHSYDSDRKLLEGAGEGGLAGFIIGAVLPGVGIPAGRMIRSRLDERPSALEKDLESTSEIEPPAGAEAAPTGGPGERFAATITPEEAAAGIGEAETGFTGPTPFDFAREEARGLPEDRVRFRPSQEAPVVIGEETPVVEAERPGGIELIRQKLQQAEEVANNQFLPISARVEAGNLRDRLQRVLIEREERVGQPRTEEAPGLRTADEILAERLRARDIRLARERASLPGEVESPKPLSATVLPIAAAEAATPEEGLAPPGPSSVEAVHAARPETQAAAALPPAIAEQGTQVLESQAQEGGEPNAIPISQAAEVPIRQSPEAGSQVGAQVRNEGAAEAQAEVTQEGGVAREEEVQRQEAVAPVPPAPAAPAVPSTQPVAEKDRLLAELADAEKFTGKAAVESEKATQAWGRYAVEVVEPLKKKVRDAENAASAMQIDASLTKPETKAKNRITKKAFFEKYGVKTKEEANALWKEKNKAWQDAIDELEKAKEQLKELERLKELASKNWSKAATRSGELRRRVYPSVREGDVGQKQSLADRIRSKKITDPNLYDATLGIPVAAWNGLVEAVALAVQAGVAIRDAVAKAINDYKERNPNSKIDDVRVAAELTRQVTPITQVPGERTVTKRFEASPDLSVGVKERLTNKLYRVLHQKDAEAVLDEIMRTVPSVDSVITIYDDVHRQVPEWLRTLLGAEIVAEFTKQETAAEKDGNDALAEQLRIKSSNFTNQYATRGTEEGQAVNAYKWVWKMSPAGAKVWAVRTVNNAAGVDINTYRDLLDKVHQILADSFKTSRTDITRHKDVTKWLNAWIDRQLHDDAEVQAAAKKAGVTSEQLFGWIKQARNANRQHTPLPPNATDLEKVLRAKVPLAITKVQQAIAGARAKEGPIGEELAAMLGMSDTDAEALSKLIKNLQGALENDRNKRAVSAFLKTLDKKLPVRVEEIVKKIIAAEGLGALNNAQWQEKLRQMFSAKKLTPDKQSELGKLAEEMHKIPEGEQNRKARAYQKLLNEVATLTENWWDLPMAVWYANMLSGVTTQYLNTASTGLNAIGEWLTTLRGGPGAFLTASEAFLKGLPDGFLEGVHTMRTGEVTTLRVLRTEPARPLERDLKGWKAVLKILRYVPRFMAAQDLLAFVPLMNMKEALLTRSFMIKEGMPKSQARRKALEVVFGTEKLRSEAAAQAAKEGYTGIEAKRRVSEIIQYGIDSSIRDLSASFARRGTFNQQKGYGVMGALVRAVNSFLREIPLARAQIPFVNVIGNVVNEGLNYTPIGTARAASSWIKYRYRNPKGGALMLYGDTATLEDVKDLTFKSMAATVLLGALAIAAAESLDGDGNDDGEGFAIFGFGPRDPSKRDTWRAEGKIPFSVRINGRYYNYVNSPLGIPLATIGNYFDAIRYKDLDANTALERAYYLLGASKDVILQQSFLDGVATILNTKDNISPTKSLEQTLKSGTRTLATFVIPNAVRQADNLFDPQIYKPEDVQGMILQSIPFARRLGKPAVNGLGEPVAYPLSARFTRAQSPDPVWRELGRLNVGVYPGQMVHNGERLDQQQLARVAELSGPRIRTMIERVMANPRWSELPDEAEGNRPDKKKVLQRIIEQQRTKAKKRVMSGS